MPFSSLLDGGHRSRAPGSSLWEPKAAGVHTPLQQEAAGGGVGRRAAPAGKENRPPAGELRVRLENGLPRVFWRRGRRHLVLEVLDRWRDTGRWWEGEAPKHFFRLRTAGGGLWEIYLDTAKNTWHLYRIYD